MDALIEWDDSSRNVVSTAELECIETRSAFKKGQRVKFLWKKEYYYGMVIDIETDISEKSARKVESDDDKPLYHLIKKRKLHSVDCETDHINDFVPITSPTIPKDFKDREHGIKSLKNVEEEMQKITENEEHQRVKRCQKSEA